MKDDVVNSNSDEITFKDIVVIVKSYSKYLLSKFKIISLIGILGGSLGLAYSITKKTTYKATLTFALEDEKPGIGGLGLTSQLGLDLGGSPAGVFSGPNLLELFKSRNMVEKALLKPIKFKNETISFAEMYIREKKWRDGWNQSEKYKGIKFLPNSKREDFTRVQDSILELIYNNFYKSGLTIIKSDKTSILSLEIKFTNEVFAKEFNETLANVVSDFYINTKNKKARINSSILERQLDSIRGELNGSIASVAIANDRTFGLNPALNVKKVPSVRRQVDVQANTAILTELIKQTELAKVNLRKETPLIQVIDSPKYPLKIERFGKLKGIILGFFLGGILIVMFLIMKRMIKDVLK